MIIFITTVLVMAVTGRVTNDGSHEKEKGVKSAGISLEILCFSEWRSVVLGYELGRKIKTSGDWQFLILFSLQ